MVLQHAHRIDLYQALSTIASEEAVGAMLSHFPTRELDEPITRDYLDQRLTQVSAELRGEMHAGFAAVEAKFASVDTKFASVDTKFARLEGRMDTKFAQLEGRFDTKLERELRRQTRWTVGAVTTLVIFFTTVSRYLG